MGRDIGPTLHQRINSFVHRWNGYYFDVFPGETPVGESAEDVVPDGKLGRIFAGDPFTFDVRDIFDRRVLCDDETAAQRRSAHEQTGVGNVRKRISSADL